MLICLKYHPISASSFTFDNFDPQGKGTIIFLSNFVPLYQLSFNPLLSESNLKSQEPFKFFQIGLSKSGLGCSARGIWALTIYAVRNRKISVPFVSEYLGVVTCWLILG